MTCNPAVATCIDAVSLWESATLTCGGLAPEISPVCSGGSSAYAEGVPALPWSDLSPRGALGYFRPAVAADAAHCTAGTLPPMNRDLPLAAYRSELPEGMGPYIAPLLRLEADFGIPVSFRIVNARLSTGEVIPQIHFFRTGEEPGTVAEPRGGGSGRGSGPSPESPSTLGLTVGLVGGSALLVAYDHLLMRPLIENGLMPAELHSPVMFASVMATHTALYRAGFVRTSPGAVLPEMPTLLGFQVLASLLLEGLEIEPGPGRDFATLALSMMPFYLARHSPVLAEALSAAGAGRWLTFAELETLGTGAATLRAGALFARALGWIALIDLGMRTATWGSSHLIAAMDEAMGEGTYEDNLRAWNLTMMSHDIINQEDCGAILAGAFGMFMMVADGGLVMFDGEYEDYLMDRRGRIQRDLVMGSDEFGRSMHTNLASILSRHIEASAGETPGELNIVSVDWSGIRRDLSAFYESEESEDAIEGGYELVDDATGHRTRSGIEGLIEVISEDGEIEDLDGFRDHMRGYVDRELNERAERHHARALELGLAEEVNGVFVFRTLTASSDLTAAQREFFDGEGLELATEISFLAILRQALLD